MISPRQNKTTLILYPAGRSGGYTIPDSVTSMQSRSLLSAGGGFLGPWVGFFYVGQGAFEGSSQLTSVQLPDGITRIGSETFKGCSALTTVTIPTSVMSIGTSPFWPQDLAGAFEDCTSLHSAIFLGDAPTTIYGNTFANTPGEAGGGDWEIPTTIDGNTFANTALGFTIYYLSTSTGFTSPTWNGYPTVMIDESIYPAASWLEEHGLDYTTDLHQDLNGDGVILLMAYALNLDPTRNLSGSMPRPAIDATSVSMRFHGTATGITYRVETSTDLVTWTATGVTLSEPDLNGIVTGSVDSDGPRRFLRLVVIRQ